jgi:hypothetical protein
VILPLSKTGHTDRFRVEYRAVRTDLFFPYEEKWRNMETRDSGEVCVTSDLERDTQYQIRHRAEDRAGESEFSDITVTEIGTGSGPGRPVVQSAGRNSVSLIWREIHSARSDTEQRTGQERVISVTSL